MKQNNKNKIVNLFFNTLYFSLKYIKTKKFIIIITKNRSGNKGPVIKHKGINKKRTNEKFINLF